MTDTIFALSSGAPPAALAVIRISGPAAFDAVAAIAGGLPDARRASLRRLRDPASGETIDRALVLIFPGPATATGEDLAELHLHGGRAVVRRMEAVLGAMQGLRGAEPGEFTRRALEAGRIDLTEAEGLADLLAAETEGQRRTAMRAAEGHLRQTIGLWNDRLLMLSAAIEAAIDHSDEADAADDDAILAEVRAGASGLANVIADVLAQPPVERLRDGIRVVLAGPPNSGKSTLFNAMVGRDAAIVSPIAGTTRDRIEAPVVRNGIAWTITDTAGLAEATDDPIEAIGIARARDSIGAADILLWLGDDTPPTPDGVDVIAVHPRADLAERASVPAGRLAVSTHDTDSVATLWSRMEHIAATLLPSGDVPALNVRQRDLCGSARAGLCSAAQLADPLIIAEELRAAGQAFDAITGQSHVENVLDALFGRFCIGK
ncbi:tRNA uridine-5-carboxymethylaminomethyl(34) synthesis GTPase MnmE [Sphingomonas floccifaciens]|uniref:tRNA modification GTPase MnmE n=1 Tax=Sphingomonas floccifaciens TaxID=1844115 RepID=A0ABW4NF49_9SPHN